MKAIVLLGCLVICYPYGKANDTLTLIDERLQARGAAMDTVLFWFQQGLTLSAKAQVWEKHANYHISRIDYSSLQERLDLNYHFLNDATPVFQQLLKEGHIAKSWINLLSIYWGNYYFKTGQNEKAKLRLSSLARDLQNETEPNLRHYRQLLSVHRYLGAIYKRTGQYDLAQTHFTYSQQFAEKVEALSRPHTAVPQTYKHLADTYRLLEQYEQALDYYQSAVSGNRKAYQRYQHPRYLNRLEASLTALADVYRRTKQYQLSLSTLGEILTYPLDSAKQANVFQALGEVYMDSGQKELAREKLEQALELRKKIYRVRAIPLAQSYLSLGILAAKEHQPKIALRQYQQALSHLTLDFDKSPNAIPQAEAILDPQLYLQIQEKKLLAMMALHQEGTAPFNLGDDLASTLQHALACLDTLHGTYQWQADHRSLMDQHYSLFETSLSALALMQQAEAHDHDKWTTLAFQVWEKSKALNLVLATRRIAAPKGFGLLDSLLEREAQLSYQLARKEQAWVGALQQAGHMDRVSELAKERLMLKQQVQAVKTAIRTAAPDYYRARHQLSVISLADFQASLARDQVCLSYFWGDSSLFVMVVRPQGCSLHLLSDKESLSESIPAFRKAIQEGDQAFASLGHQLYNTLLAPVVSQLSASTRLTFFLDGPLNYVPMEALVREPVTKRNEIRYLIRDWAISYAYSATLLAQTRQKAIRYLQHQTALSVAPLVGLPADSSSSAGRTCLIPVANEAEARIVASIWGGDTLLGRAGKIEAFLKLAPRYPLLHISTHGLIDPEQSRFSFLAFYAKDSLLESPLCQQATLHAKGFHLLDLYTLSLPGTELVVLAACETGYGAHYRGEGVESLARGFTYAGARSVVASLWRISDQGSIRIMKNFHLNLQAGMPKDLALQQAKLAIIEEGGSRIAPYFWAGYIPLGDMRPLAIAQNHLAWEWWLLGLSVLLVGIWIWKIRHNPSPTSNFSKS